MKMQNLENKKYKWSKSNHLRFTDHKSVPLIVAGVKMMITRQRLVDPQRGGVCVGGGSGGGGGRGGVAILNFVCYIGWAPASSVCQKPKKNIRYISHTPKNIRYISHTPTNIRYISHTPKNIRYISNTPKKYPVYQQYPQNIPADISIPKKDIPLAFFFF